MTLYVIENDNGEVLDRICYEFTSDVDRALLFDEPIAPAEYAKRYGGHVIELVEKQEPVVVSEEEAKLLKRAKGNGWRVAGAIHQHMRAALPSSEPFDVGTKLEDRLMRAYVNGWTVKQESKYYVKVPGRFSGGDRFYCRLQEEFSETAQLLDGDPRFMLTMAEIEQLGLTRCERVEVTDDGND